MNIASAYQDKNGEWVYPQVYYRDGKRISKKKLLDQIQNNTLVQEAIRIEPRIGQLIERAKRQRCVYGYKAVETFYDEYKPLISNLVGWSSPHKALHTEGYYDAVYDAIYDLLPADENDLYPDGVMPNGEVSPQWQEE